MLVFCFFYAFVSSKRLLQQNFELDRNQVLKSVQSKIEKFEIPYFVRIIGAKCFINSTTTLTTVDFANAISLLRISSSAFENCEKLVDIDLSNCINLWTIEEDAFAKTGLKTLRLPNYITTLGDRAFLSTRLVQINIPNGLVSIGIACFKDSPITFVNISKSSSLAVIQPESFMNTAITSFFIPSGLALISTLAFKNTHVINFTIDPRNRFVTYETVFYNKNHSKVLASPPTIVGKLVLPDTITEISESCFEYCDVQEISFTNVTLIGPRAFYYSSIKNIVIPETVKIIGHSAFENCKNLMTLKILNSDLVIGLNAFRHTNLVCDVMIPVPLIPNAIEQGVSEKSFNECTNIAKK